MVLDYMRGNGCVLTFDGYKHLCARGSFNSRGLSQVVGALQRGGYLEEIGPPYEKPYGATVYATLTDLGRRA
jgi:hypothetical protein